MREAGFNYAWAPAPRRVHNKARVETERGREAKIRADSKDCPNFNCFDVRKWKVLQHLRQAHVNFRLQMEK